MSTNELINQMRTAIELELKQSIDQFNLDKKSELYTMLCYHMGWQGDGAGLEAQGKRIRPTITLLSAAAIGSDWHKALPAAAAVELLHNFSLIHDDIQDQSPLRRGRPTVWNKWGVAQAINAGDALFTLSHLTLLRISESAGADIAVKAARSLHSAAIEITNGQYHDLSFESKSAISLDAYWNMISGKTAALLGCSTELGGLVVGADSLQDAALKQLGVSLGLAFQVQDDWLGIWGDSAMTGKSTESDIVSGKKTLPILFALSQEGAFKTRWKKGPITSEEVPWVAKLLVDNGSQEYTQKMGDKLATDALRAIDRLSTSNEGVDGLRELIGTLSRRQK
jgi:geranylgeranyl diphosphate synthase, type I